MPFCPKCKYEYRPEVSKCPDCDEFLVSSLPMEPEATDEVVEYKDWIPIARMTSSQYAEMILDVLHQKNIPAVLSDSSGHFGQTGQMGISSFRPIAGAFTALYVPREFAVDAGHEAEVIMGEDWEKARLNTTN